MTEQQERALTAGLKALAGTTRNASAAPEVEAAVLAQMKRESKPASASPGWLPVAAALMLASATGVWLAWDTPGNRLTPIQPAGFVEVPGAAILPPMESGAIIRVSLPVTALPSYGIQITDVNTYSVEADLLVAQDGTTRAIRLVANSNTSRSTP